MTRLRPVASLAAVSLALVAAGCGGEAAGEANVPAFPAEVGASLAADATAIAERADAGDIDGALADARALEREARAAIAGDAVPGGLRAPLLEGIAALVASLEAAVPVPPPTEKGDEEHEDDESKGRDNGKKKGRKHAEGD